MILFLNFAPFSFAGGAERWMLEVSSEISNSEKTVLIDVEPSIANIYGKIVLNRSYSSRLILEKKSKFKKFLSLSILSFIPFTKQWKFVKSLFAEARLIYIRYEFLEILILILFGNFELLKKTIAGIHSPYLYPKPITFFHRLHNLFYSSFISKFFLNKMRRIHVVNQNDEQYFRNKFNLSNIAYIPNFIEEPKGKTLKNTELNKKILNILFVGELNLRKGTDVLIDTIKKSSSEFKFYAAGDGVMKKEINELNYISNFKYQGYLNKSDLVKLYQMCDVLFVPSRAESFSLVCLEAMSYGMPIVSSPQLTMGLPLEFQKINKSGAVNDYIHLFNLILRQKRKGKLILLRKKIITYINENFSRSVILPNLKKELFRIEKNEKGNSF